MAPDERSAQGNRERRPREDHTSFGVAGWLCRVEPDREQSEAAKATRGGNHSLGLILEDGRTTGSPAHLADDPASRGGWPSVSKTGEHDMIHDAVYLISSAGAMAGLFDRAIEAAPAAQQSLTDRSSDGIVRAIESVRTKHGRSGMT